MRTLVLATLFALVGALGPSACDEQERRKAETKKADDEDGKKAHAKPDVVASDAKADDAKREPEPTDDAKAVEPTDSAPIALTKLGLRGQAPKGTTVGGLEFDDGVMIQGPNGVAASVGLASDAQPKTEAEAKKDAESTYKAKNLASETLEDGFAVTFENETPLGTNFWVNARRDIGGKAYWCSTTASSPEQQAAVLAFCKSLAQ
jgi:hypothetical protein